MSSHSETGRFFAVDYHSVQGADIVAGRGPGTVGFHRGNGLVSVLPSDTHADPIDVQFSLDRAREVTRDGRSISFVISPLPGGARTRVHFETCSDAVAAEIAERLSRPPPTEPGPAADSLEQASFPQAHRRFIERLARLTPHPFITYALMGANVLVFLAMLTQGAGFLQSDAQVHMVWGANFGPATASGEWWRLLASTFLHFGVFHLAMNVWALYDAGRVVERLFGHRAFLAIYLLAGATGSVASLLWNPASVSVGASGAVFGVFGALLAYLLRQPRSVPPRVLSRLRLVTLAFVAYALVFGFLIPRVDNAAHVGGLIGGFLQGLLLARPLDTPSRPTGAWTRLGAGLLLGGMLLAALLVVVPQPPFDYRQEMAFNDAVWLFAREEKRIAQQFKAQQRLFDAGSISAVEFSRWLEEHQAPALNAEAARIAAVELSGAAPSKGKQKLLLEYAGLRQAATRLYAQYLRTGDPETLQRVRTDNGKADALVAQLLASPAAPGSASGELRSKPSPTSPLPPD